MRHLMSPLDLSVEETDKLLNLANDIENNPEKYAHPVLTVLPLPKEKVFPILSVSSPVMLISVQCVTRRKVLR